VSKVQVKRETGGGRGRRLGLRPTARGPRVLEPVDDVGGLQPSLGLSALQTVKDLRVLLSLVKMERWMVLRPAVCWLMPVVTRENRREEGAAYS